MKTLQALTMVIKRRQTRKVPSYQETKVSPQAEMVCEAVDMIVEPLAVRLERLESQLTQARKADTSGVQFDPE